MASVHMVGWVLVVFRTVSPMGLVLSPEKACVIIRKCVLLLDPFECGTSNVIMLLWVVGGVFPFYCFGRVGYC